MHIARPLLIPLVAALVVATAPAVAAELIIINKSTQEMTVAVDGVPRWNWPVSTGQHFSKEWAAPMPYSIFSTPVGSVAPPPTAAYVSRPRTRPSYALVEVQGLTNAKVVLTGDVRAVLARRLTRVRNPEEAVVSNTRSLPTALGLRPTISRLDD